MTGAPQHDPTSRGAAESSTEVTNTSANSLSIARRKQTTLGIKILIGLLIIAAPVLVASQFITGLTGVAFYGVLAATFGWIAGGPRIGAAVVATLTVLAMAAILLEGHTWLLALMLLALGTLYGYAAGRGFGSAVVQLPILTPYFMMDAPGLFTDPPSVGPAYLGGVTAVMVLSGLWTILVLHLAMPSRIPKRHTSPDPRMSLLYGTLLGMISAIVMILGTTTELKLHWVWVTLTLYVLADPTRLFTRNKMFGRVLGTLAGFALVTLLALVGIPDSALQILAFPALWFCLFYLVTKRPYWQYSLFLTVTVVLMNSYGVNTILLDAERIVFTIVGALLSILAAFLVNLLHYRRRGLAVQQP